MTDILSIVGSVEAVLSEYRIDEAEDSKRKLLKEIESNFSGAIPYDIKAYLLGIDEIAEDINHLFEGYQPMQLAEIANEYRDIANSSYFREHYITDEPDPPPSTTIDTVAPVGLCVGATLEGEVDDEEYEVRDMRRVLPLLNGGSNYYVVLFHNESGATELALQQQDFLLWSIAPSLSDHLSNIREGLERDIYSVRPGYLRMPRFWYERVMALRDSSFTEDSWS